MCIYCGTTKYRRIYESHCGPIPIDEHGRRYEVHHIDGNRTNNEPSNLIALSIQEHYDIHYAQGDWAACNLIAKHLNLSKEERSDLSRKNALNRVSEGTHNLQKNGPSRKAQLESVYRKIEDGTFHFLDKKWARDKELTKVSNGTHPFLKKTDGASVGAITNKKRIEKGTHNFIGPSMNKQMFENGTHPITKMLETGTHPAHKEWTCETCGKSGKGMSQLSRHRNGKNCHK
jgi:hypothetical protein